MSSKIACSLLILLCTAAAALGQYAPPPEVRGWDRGQDVSPTFDGWVRNADGTYSFYFGYLNRNRAEEVYVPIGPDNTVGDFGDRGQPTYFYPMGKGTVDRKWWVFKVDVPADWPKDKRLVWTLKSKGKINKAVAWLQAEYEVDPVLIGRNARDSFLFEGETVADVGNQAPKVSGATRYTATTLQEMPLAVTVVDDKRPYPSEDIGADDDGGGAPRKSGTRVRWFLHRGPTAVKFTPDRQGPFPATPARAETKVIFRRPGEYRLRAVAGDGELVSTYDIDVTVSPR